MRIKNFLSCVCAASLVALSLVGCSDYDNGYTEEQLKFIQGFKDAFGEIDHTQDWNLAERGTVTVTTSKSSRVKIYAKTFGTYKLVGDYEDVSGTHTLGFDMLEGTTDIMVSDGITAQRTKVGKSIVFAGTRHIFAGDESKDIDGVKVVSVGEKMTFEFPFIEAVLDVLPERQDNTDKVTNNFTYISEGEFVIYPIYSQTSSTHILGIYWRDSSDELHTQHIYQTTKGGSVTENEFYEPNFTYDEEDNGSNTYNRNVIGGSCTSTGVVINLPPGTPFGFYLEVYDPEFCHCVYSDEELNKAMKGESLTGQPSSGRGQYITESGTNRKDGDAVFGATFTKDVTVTDDEGNVTAYYEGVEFLCFEDWDNAAAPDFNDLVFAFKENAPTVVEESAMSWVLSCEDLGGTFDLDYNDVVLKVEHIGGRSTATVTPLAAGGTLASYIYFNGTNGIEELGEIHSYFGQDEMASGTYTPVNVSDPTPTTTRKKEPYKIHVDPQKWSLSTFARQTNETMAGNMTPEDAKNHTMGGFFIIVMDENESGVPDVNNLGKYKYSKIQNEVDPIVENVPYIICTPSTWTRSIGNGKALRGNYRWPQEHVAMYKFGDFQGAAYDSNDTYSFQKWVKDGTDQNARYWYAFPYCDDVGQYSNTCASSAPREISTDVDMDDTGFDYDGLNKRSPDLHIVEEDKDGFTIGDDGSISVNLAKGEPVYNDNGDKISFYRTTITIASKSGRTPTIVTDKELTGNNDKFEYSDGGSIYTGNIKEGAWTNGYYTWVITIDLSSQAHENGEISKLITLKQEESYLYTASTTSFTTINTEEVDESDFGDRIAESLTGDTTLSKEYFANANTKITITVLIQPCEYLYMYIYSSGNKIDEIDEHPSKAFYKQIEISDAALIQTIKANGISITDHNNGKYLDGVAGLWIKNE